MPAPVEPRQLRLELTPPQVVRETSALLWPSEDPDSPALVLAHGAGTDMTHPLLRGVARGLSEAGFPVLLFNFGFTEVGRRRPDPLKRLLSAWEDVIRLARPQLGADRPLVIGGRSLGGRIASLLVAEQHDVDGLVFLGYPLHPAGRPGRLRTDHWERLDVPVLFVSGDRDALANLDLLDQERQERLSQIESRVHVVRGGDHGFKVRKKDGRSPSEVHAEVVSAVAAWLRELPGG